MSRRSKKLAFRKMRALVHYIMAKLPDRDVDELALKVRFIMFRSDFEHYQLYGRPLMPKGFRWIKREDGPDLVWRPKRRSQMTRFKLYAERRGEHVHVTVFATQGEGDHPTYANTGKLIMRVGEYQIFGAALAHARDTFGTFGGGNLDVVFEGDLK